MQKVKMETKLLGRTGLLVSEICLGTMTIGSSAQNTWGMSTANEETSFQMLETFAEMGGNFIDEANVYGMGDSERVVGRWLQTKNRQDFVIGTKARGRIGPNPNDVGLSRKHILSAIEDSLKNLQTNYIDLYQVHCWDSMTPLSETWKTLDDLVRCGKVRYLGISNYTGVQVQKTVDLVREMRWESVVCLQPQYNLLCRSPEWDLIPTCEAEGLGVIPFSPLAGGWLSGRMKRGVTAPESGSRVDWAEKIGMKPTGFSSQAKEQTWRILDALESISKETGKTVAQISLRWLMQKRGVTAPIIGAKTVQQLKDNLGCVGWKLSEQQMKALDEASMPESIPYPWGEYWNSSRELPINLPQETK